MPPKLCCSTTVMATCKLTAASVHTPNKTFCVYIHLEARTGQDLAVGGTFCVARWVILTFPGEPVTF